MSVDERVCDELPVEDEAELHGTSTQVPSSVTGFVSAVEIHDPVRHAYLVDFQVIL